MKNNKLWLVVLFNGNHMPIMIDESQRVEMTSFLNECVKFSKDDLYHYSVWGDFTIISKNIIGWYFKEVEENTIQERILKATEKMVDEVSSGDDWKSE